MIAPIEKIKSLTTEDVQTLFGEDVLNSAFEEAFKFVNSLITDNACYEALVSSYSNPEGYKTDSKTIPTGNKLGWNDDDFLRNRRILYVNRRLSGSTYIPSPSYFILWYSYSSKRTCLYTNGIKLNTILYV
jgi:hypothetical protein